MALEECQCKGNVRIYASHGLAEPVYVSYTPAIQRRKACIPKQRLDESLCSATPTTPMQKSIADISYRNDTVIGPGPTKQMRSMIYFMEGVSRRITTHQYVPKSEIRRESTYTKETAKRRRFHGSPNDLGDDVLGS